MAFAHTVVTSQEIPSALVALQERSIRGECLSEGDITHAIGADLERGVAVSEVFLSKFVCGNTKVSSGAIESLIILVQAKMSDVLLSNPDLFLTYGKAAAVLARELRRRVVGLHLV